eukprot:212637-Alexandrium_andersonii.AAC.1
MRTPLAIRVNPWHGLDSSKASWLEGTRGNSRHCAARRAWSEHIERLACSIKQKLWVCLWIEPK